MPGIRTLVEGFAPARSIAGQERALLKRIDLKYPVHVDAVPTLLEALTPHFEVLRAGGVRLATYDTLYFDSPDHGMFHAHRRGRKVRHKVRLRVYEERQLRVLEVKSKFHGDRTEKARLPIPWGTELPTQDDLAWALARGVGVAQLAPVAWTRFKRLTLVGSALNERVTIDLDLRFECGGQTVSLPDLAIFEVKQWPRDRRSPTVRALKAAGHRQHAFSKYCAAVAILKGERHNRLKPALRLLARMRGRA